MGEDCQNVLSRPHRAFREESVRHLVPLANQLVYNVSRSSYTRLSRTSADLESDRHPIRRRSSSSLYDTLLANHSLLPPGVRHLRSADDTSLTPGSSSSSTTMDRQSSRTPEPESSRSVDQFGDEYLESKTIDNQSYQLPSYSRSETREADTSSDTDLFWGSPSTFPDALHPHTQQGFDYHYEAAHFDANPCPSQTPTGAVQPTSHFPDPDFFTSQPSLFTQPAYNIPCTVDFTHTRMTHPNGDILDQRIYGTDDVQSSGVSLPTLPSSSVPLFRPGTPDFSLFTLPAERLTGDANTLPALDLHKSLGDGAQSLTSDLAIPNNSSAPRRDSSPGDADASLMQTVEGHSYGDSQSCVTMASAHHGEQVTVAVALCDYKDIRVTVQSLVDTLRRR
jgi:hypothetical protein